MTTPKTPEKAVDLAATALVQAEGYSRDTHPALFSIVTSYRRLFDDFLEETGALWAPNGTLSQHYGYGKEDLFPPDLSVIHDTKVFSIDEFVRAAKAKAEGHEFKAVFSPPETHNQMIERIMAHPTVRALSSKEISSDFLRIEDPDNNNLWRRNEATFRYVQDEDCPNFAKMIVEYPHPGWEVVLMGMNIRPPNNEGVWAKRVLNLVIKQLN